MRISSNISTAPPINRTTGGQLKAPEGGGMRPNLKLLSQEAGKTSDAISVIQTAEGGLNEVNHILTRMKELAMESAGVLPDTTDREKLEEEYQQLVGELNRISEGTAFNGTKLLSGDFSEKTPRISRIIRETPVKFGNIAMNVDKHAIHGLTGGEELPAPGNEQPQGGKPAPARVQREPLAPLPATPTTQSVNDLSPEIGPPPEIERLRAAAEARQLFMQVTPGPIPPQPEPGVRPASLPPAIFVNRLT